MIISIDAKKAVDHKSYSQDYNIWRKTETISSKVRNETRVPTLPNTVLESKTKQ
jgi:hypothetical protein